MTRIVPALVFFSLCLLISSCGGGGGSDDDESSGDSVYRDRMRQFVQAVSGYAKARRSGFIVIPQNGQELLTTNGESGGPVAQAYTDAIDGLGREDLFYGFDSDDSPTPPGESAYMTGFLNLALSLGIRPLVTDYCSTRSYVDDSYQRNNDLGFISFAADRRELDDIPAYPAAPYAENGDDVVTLFDAANFLYVLDPGAYGSRADFIAAVNASDFDVIITDLFVYPSSGPEEEFTAADIASMKTKNNGAARLLICYMSIGEAENYRYYWQSSWNTEPPDWLAAENPDWPGNYKVRYWYADWQNIIMGDNDAYLDRILAAGFDGVYLDIIDAFEYFE